MALTDLQLLRIYIADNEEPFVMTDDELTAFLEMSNGNVAEAANELRPIYGLKLSSTQTREREGNVEVYGGDKSRNYLQYLKFFETEQIGIGNAKLAVPVIGGVSKKFKDKVNTNPDSIGAGFEVGMFSSGDSEIFGFGSTNRRGRLR